MNTRAIGVGAALALALASPALAHHSFAMFDRSKPLSWTGTVEQYQWENPHTHIILMVPNSAADKRTVGRWDIESAATNILIRQGWSNSTLKPGDKVTVVGYPLKSGAKGAALFYAITPDGRKLYHDVNRDEGSTPTKS